jgi:2-polyprenyl-6-methoxyphenol hydroxylase-like FAD-dependent oxidoreductase
MLKAVDGWDEKLKAVIRSIPEGVIIDWKLLWRDPVKNWVTPSGRIAIVGDSAHPHLATSGQGAAQAIEDGATIAALLDRAGKDIPLAFRAFERLRYISLLIYYVMFANALTMIRYERTSLTQRMGWELRQVWHQTDWAAVRANPDLLKMPQPAWLFGGDAEKYAYDNYDAVVEHILKGTPFTSINVPEGYVHEEWTIETMMKAEQAGEEALLTNVQA